MLACAGLGLSLGHVVGLCEIGEHAPALLADQREVAPEGSFDVDQSPLRS